jgi:branched-chain amino acid transport system substrate-binding protein
MKRILLTGATLLAAGVISGAALAQDTVKIGIVLPYTGQFANAATQLDNGIKLYVKQHGDTVAGKKLEFFRKDVGGIKPPSWPAGCSPPTRSPAAVCRRKPRSSWLS